MGCICMRENSNQVELESKITSSSEKLKLSSFRSDYLDKVVHRHCTNFKTSPPQFVQILKTLELDSPDSRIKDFFNLFYNPTKGHYNTNKLSTLCIHLGKSSYSERAQLLFHNYDRDFSNSLDKAEIRKMIKHIYFIACNYLPKLAMVFADNDLREDIEKYKLKLNNMSNGVISYFTKLVLEDVNGDKIELEGFVRVMSKPELEGILDFEFLRKKTIELHNMISKAAKAASLYMIKENYKFRERVRSLE